ncbi:MAG: helix-turn-helix domain-containing protein [Oscillospiraceae bacterium]|nr:helix-turn-helix domain-containing protein [Oscillospiraceae bacterium]
MQTYISPQQAGQKLNLSMRAIYRLLKNGQIPAVKVGGAWRIPSDTLEKRLEEQAARAER